MNLVIKPPPSSFDQRDAACRCEWGVAGVGQLAPAGYSLSPASFLDAPSGLRCVLPSPNGATVTTRAANIGTIVLAGCLRNASAVAATAQRLGSTFNVCPAGERWPDGSLRFAIEDRLAAGAILRGLPGTKSSEAHAAIAAFEHLAGRIAVVVAGSSLGRELIDRGFPRDVELATALDVSDHVPRFDGTAFVMSPRNVP